MHREVLLRIKGQKETEIEEGIEIEKNKNQDMNRKKIKCTSPWEYYVVNWDGKVTACCKDFDMELVYGDFNTQSIEEIIFSDKLLRLKKSILRNDFSEFKKCLTCPGLRGKLESKILEEL